MAYGGEGRGPYGGFDDDDERPVAGTYKVPDKDFYRKSINHFATVATFLQDRL